MRRRSDPPTDALLKAPEAREAYEEEILLGRLDEQIKTMLKKTRLTQQQLAREMRVTGGRVSQILAGRENLTIRTLVRLATAMDHRWYVGVEPIDPDEALEDPYEDREPPVTFIRHDQLHPPASRKPDRAGLNATITQRS